MCIRDSYNCLKAQVQKQINEAEQNMRYADRFFFDNNGSAIELLTEMNAAIHLSLIHI